MQSDTDRIEKKILLRAPRARVWLALTDAAQFGAWFGVRLDRPFVEGQSSTGLRVEGSGTGSCEGPLVLRIASIVPERHFSFRWHPVRDDPAVVDYAAEPTTLVVFTLEERPEGTLLTVTESGFDRVPPARRARAFTTHQQGWPIYAGRLEEHLAHAR